MISLHVRICVGLALLSIPVAIADAQILGKGSGGGWIYLDFKGFFIGAYLFFLPIHFVVSTIAVNAFPKANVWMIHPPSALVAILLLCGGVYLHMELQDKSQDKADRARQAEHKLLENVITLDRWGFSTSPDSATDIFISLTVSESGRFAVRATGRGEGDYGEWYFQSEDVEQRMVAKGEHFDYHIPLKRHRYGVPDDIEITLSLYADTTGSAKKNIIKVFYSFPAVIEDSQRFYVPLPKVTARP